VRFAFRDECEGGSATLPNDAALAQLAEQLFCKTSWGSSRLDLAPGRQPKRSLVELYGA